MNLDSGHVVVAVSTHALAESPVFMQRILRDRFLNVRMATKGRQLPLICIEVNCHFLTTTGQHWKPQKTLHKKVPLYILQYVDHVLGNHGQTMNY
jgi:hypothetical protein